MTLVVADAGPINYLVQLEAIDLLRTIFGEVVIPASVRKELAHPKTPKQVRDWISNLPDWARVRSVECVRIEALDAGETEAIALTELLGAFAILVDDYAARDAARAKAIRVFGTIGILEEASKTD